MLKRVDQAYRISNLEWLERKFTKAALIASYCRYATVRWDVLERYGEKSAEFLFLDAKLRQNYCLSKGWGFATYQDNIIDVTLRQFHEKFPRFIVDNPFLMHIKTTDILVAADGLVNIFTDKNNCDNKILNPFDEILIFSRNSQRWRQLIKNLDDICKYGITCNFYGHYMDSAIHISKITCIEQIDCEDWLEKTSRVLERAGKQLPLKVRARLAVQFYRQPWTL